MSLHARVIMKAGVAWVRVPATEWKAFCLAEWSTVGAGQGVDAEFVDLALKDYQKIVLASGRTHIKAAFERAGIRRAKANQGVRVRREKVVTTPIEQGKAERLVKLVVA